MVDYSTLVQYAQRLGETYLHAMRTISLGPAETSKPKGRPVMLVKQGEDSKDSFPPDKGLNSQDINAIGSEWRQVPSGYTWSSNTTSYNPHVKSYPSTPRSRPSPSGGMEAARKVPDMVHQRPNPMIRTSWSNWQQTTSLALLFCATGDHLANVPLVCTITNASKTDGPPGRHS